MFLNFKHSANGELDGWEAGKADKLFLDPDWLGEVLVGTVPALPQGDAQTKGHHAPGQQLVRVPATFPLHYIQLQSYIYK